MCHYHSHPKIVYYALRHGKCHQIFHTYLSSNSLGFCCDSEYLEVFCISGQDLERHQQRQRYFASPEWQCRR